MKNYVSKITGAGIAAYAAVFSASIAFAQTGGDAQAESIKGLVSNFIDIANIVVQLMIVVAVIVFIWGLISFVFSKGADKKADARHLMIYGVLGFAVIAGLWGLVTFVLNFFAIDGEAQINIPTLPSQN